VVTQVVSGIDRVREGAHGMVGVFLGAVAFEVVAVADLVAEGVGDGAQVMRGVVTISKDDAVGVSFSYL
jgi:hypothetical protein